MGCISPIAYEGAASKHTLMLICEYCTTRLSIVTQFNNRVCVYLGVYEFGGDQYLTGLNDSWGKEMSVWQLSVCGGQHYALATVMKHGSLKLSKDRKLINEQQE